MNGYLLDTNIVLFVLDDSPHLTKSVRRAISEGPNYISVTTYWEVTIKSVSGKLNVGDLSSWWDQTLHQLIATPLLNRPQHVAAIASLPSIHGDPFDRMLIAQAMTENLTLLTTDREIARYASSNFKVIV